MQRWLLSKRGGCGICELPEPEAEEQRDERDVGRTNPPATAKGRWDFVARAAGASVALAKAASSGDQKELRITNRCRGGTADRWVSLSAHSEEGDSWVRPRAFSVRGSHVVSILLGQLEALHCSYEWLSCLSMLFS